MGAKERRPATNLSRTPGSPTRASISSSLATGADSGGRLPYPRLQGRPHLVEPGGAQIRDGPLDEAGVHAGALGGLCRVPLTGLRLGDRHVRGVGAVLGVLEREHTLYGAVIGYEAEAGAIHHIPLKLDVHLPQRIPL